MFCTLVTAKDIGCDQYTGRFQSCKEFIRYYTVIMFTSLDPDHGCKGMQTENLLDIRKMYKISSCTKQYRAINRRCNGMPLQLLVQIILSIWCSQRHRR